MIVGVFWQLVCRYAFRKVAEYGGPRLGVPGIRDPRDTCDAYSPRPAMRGDWRTCQTDHHPLCAECCHAAPAEERQPPPPPAEVRVVSLRGDDSWYVN